MAEKDWLYYYQHSEEQERTPSFRQIMADNLLETIVGFCIYVGGIVMGLYLAVNSMVLQDQQWRCGPATNIALGATNNAVNASYVTGSHAIKDVAFATLGHMYLTEGFFIGITIVIITTIFGTWLLWHFNIIHSGFVAALLVSSLVVVSITLFIAANTPYPPLACPT